MEQNNKSNNIETTNRMPNNIENKAINSQFINQSNAQLLSGRQKIDFNKLDPIQKQQIIENAIRQENAKCRIEKPKSCKSIIIFCIIIVLFCIISMIVLNNILTSRKNINSIESNKWEIIK